MTVDPSSCMRFMVVEVPNGGFANERKMRVKRWQRFYVVFLEKVAALPPMIS
jgi:hypothetical protein